ncbi:MAG: GNAT family N-acetyltransferase [Oscillospiraceae bacterium]|nr:GNAT family N-acetyltransferase [Oscillospiraceae bacterium]
MKSILHGKRIALRPLREEDAGFFARWYNDPEVMFECGFYEPTTLEEELKRIQRPEETDREWYAVTEKETGRLLGETGLLRMWPHWHCTDMSVIIPDPEDQGRGYGREAGRLMLDRAFHHYRFNRVSIGVVALNTKAVQYWERLGFRQEGIQEQGYFCHGEFSDFIMMRILKSEYCAAG